MSPYISWLIAGIICLALEALGVNGVGLLFAGTGAFTAGVWVYITPNTSSLAQYVIFFVATCVWTVLLWKPIQRFHAQKAGGYNNIVGDTAYIGVGGLTKDGVGEATWSGTIMKARLSPDANVEAVAGGSQVVIAEVTGNTLIVKPKP